MRAPASAIRSPTTPAGRFAINATSGQITVANGSLLDYETATSHSITVRMTDQGGLTFDKAFTVSLSDVNEAPTNATFRAARLPKTRRTAQRLALSRELIPTQARH